MADLNYLNFSQQVIPMPLKFFFLKITFKRALFIVTNSHTHCDNGLHVGLRLHKSRNILIITTQFGKPAALALKPKQKKH